MNYNEIMTKALNENVVLEVTPVTSERGFASVMCVATLISNDGRTRREIRCAEIYDEKDALNKANQSAQFRAVCAVYGQNPDVILKNSKSNNQTAKQNTAPNKQTSPMQNNQPVNKPADKPVTPQNNTPVQNTNPAQQTAPVENAAPVQQTPPMQNNQPVQNQTVQTNPAMQQNTAHVQQTAPTQQNTMPNQQTAPVQNNQQNAMQIMMNDPMNVSVNIGKYANQPNNKITDLLQTAEGRQFLVDMSNLMNSPREEFNVMANTIRQFITKYNIRF
jgi:hypothetical protein